MFIRNYIRALLLLLPFYSFSQNYPVQITTQLVAPFSGYIPDYSNPGEEKMKLLFLFTDFTKPSYNVKLKISIQGQGITIQSKPYFFDGPHTLEPGIPFELSGTDLFNLLNPQNLDFQGITKTQYEQKKVLPEGFYTICVTAYDFNNPTAIQVSNVACAQAWMVLSDPPFLNLPMCSSTVSIINPQQLSFAFTQMNMGSPNSAANTEYVLELWEVRPQGAVANNVVQTTPPIFTYTTNFTLVNYGITEPPLLPGMEYAWRVKAQDITGRDLFKNNGYSQVCTFTYGSVYNGLNLDLNLHAQPVSQRQIKVWWDSLANFTSYKLEFRKAGSNGNWFPVNTPNCHVRILDLEPQTTYEFHVQGMGSEFTSNFSDPVTATTQPMPNYQCGELPGFLTHTNFTPLQQANAGMVWQVGQFEMRVTELLNPVSPSGVYSGFGKVKMPFIEDVYCSFTNVSVSNEQVVVHGRVDALTKGIEQWVSSQGVGNIQNGTAEPEVHVNSPLTTNNILPNYSNGTVLVGGTTYTYTPNGLTIEDSNGSLFIVTADGQVINAGTAGNGQGAVPDSKNFIVTDKGTVNFTGGVKQLYGIDKYKHASLANYYLTVRNLSTDNREPVDWKSVMAQKYDVIDLNYQLQGNLKADSILFITGTGTVYKPQGTGNARQLYIIGSKHGDVQELFACYRYSKDSIINIAKLNIVGYSEVKNKVTLVPLGAGVSLDKVQLQKQLNDIYKQGVATWELDIAPAITVSDTLWDKDGNGRINAGSDIFTRYSSELKKINKYIRAQSYYKSNEYYLVVTSKPTDSLQAGLLGEMPRGANIGYLFTSTPSATLIAHELGHGAYVLEHSFDGNATLPKNSSACLMDYNNGTELYKGKYWDYIHNPITVIGALEGDDEGAFDSNQLIMSLLNKIKVSIKDNSSITIAEHIYLRSKDLYVGGNKYDFLYVNVNGNANSPVTFTAKGKLSGKVANGLNFGAASIPIALVDINNGLIQIYAPSDRLVQLSNFLMGTNPGKNLLLFVSGYRANITIPPADHPKPPDEISLTDNNAYWEGIDASFINRIGTRNAVYADGHDMVSTSNHLDHSFFIANLREWECASNLSASAYQALLVNVQLGLSCLDYYHNIYKFHLHTKSNTSGFAQRRANGKKAGLDLILKIMGGTIPFDIEKDSIDIVSHSMGYAYSLGIVDALRLSGKKFKFGRMYCLAPENASAGGPPIELFEEVWQYGSDEKLPAWEQDGVAPQVRIPNIDKKYPNTKTGRFFFPTSADPKHFLNSHYATSYNWIFNILYDKNLSNGCVKSRK